MLLLNFITQCCYSTLLLNKRAIFVWPVFDFLRPNKYVAETISKSNDNQYHLDYILLNNPAYLLSLAQKWWDLAEKNGNDVFVYGFNYMKIKKNVVISSDGLDLLGNLAEHPRYFAGEAFYSKLTWTKSVHLQVNFE